MHETGDATPSVGYLTPLWTNRPFRTLWYGQLVSQLGDWLDSIALFASLLRLTGSGTAVGLVLVAQFLPPALVGLGAGVLIGRLPRKQVMIAADIGRALLVLLFGWAPTFAFAAIALIIAHMGGVVEWVYSTALIQIFVPDRLRGRIFSIEYVGFTLLTSLSSFGMGRAHDAGYSPRTLAFVTAGLFSIGSLPYSIQEHIPRSPIWLQEIK